MRFRWLIVAVGALIAAYGVSLVVPSYQLISQACDPDSCVTYGPFSGLSLGAPLIILGLAAVAYGVSRRGSDASG
jgi:hypothetical protein